MKRSIEIMRSYNNLNEIKYKMMKDPLVYLLFLGFILYLRQTRQSSISSRFHHVKKLVFRNSLWFVYVFLLLNFFLFFIYINTHSTCIPFTKIHLFCVYHKWRYASRQAHRCGYFTWCGRTSITDITSTYRKFLIYERTNGRIECRWYRIGRRREVN